MLRLFLEGILAEALVRAHTLLLVEGRELLPSERRHVLPVAALVAAARATTFLAVFQVCLVIFSATLVPVLRSVIEQRLDRLAPRHRQLVAQVVLEVVQWNGWVLQVPSLGFCIFYGILWTVLHMDIVDGKHVLVGRANAISKNLP